MKRIYPNRAARNGALSLIFVLGALSADALSNDKVARDVKLTSTLCESVGTWIDPATGRQLEFADLLQSLASRSAVLLGESHTNAEDHRWQLHTSAAIRGWRGDLVLGFEMFPRAVQPVLDRWVAGELGEREFLDSARWNEVWGYDAKHYLPLFHFARQNRIPMVALNVERSLVTRVGREGWDAVPREQREGLSDPAPATEDYRHRLAEVYVRKGALAEGESERRPSDPEAVLGDAEFQRFVAAQLTWDRAMAEALVDASKRHNGALAIGIMGRGHVVFGHGVAHQMSDLGVPDVATLLPVAAASACSGIESGMADAVFLVAEPEMPAPRPLLGVRIESSDDGVRVASVSAESVAEDAGVRVGDVIVSAAGQPVSKPGELIGIIRRQAPGTWLPLEILRAEERLEIVAKFPTEFDTHGER